MYRETFNNLNAGFRNLGNIILEENDDLQKQNTDLLSERISVNEDMKKIKSEMADLRNQLQDVTLVNETFQLQINDIENNNNNDLIC